jgi:hypothetical protein
MTFMNTHRQLVDALANALMEIQPAMLIRALANVELCPFTGHVTADQLAIALAEQDVWPRSIMADCESAEVIQFRR